MLSTQTARIEWSLFLLRIGVFVVMFAWTIDKFVNPEHASKVFESFYLMEGIGATPMMIIGAIEIVIILGFLLGIAKRWTYGLVLIFHAISTLSSWQKYTVDINLLFFAAWPMLAACIALYLLRDLDTKFTVSRPDQPAGLTGTERRFRDRFSPQGKGDHPWNTAFTMRQRPVARPPIC